MLIKCDVCVIQTINKNWYILQIEFGFYTICFKCEICKTMYWEIISNSHHSKAGSTCHEQKNMFQGKFRTSLLLLLMSHTFLSSHFVKCIKMIYFYIKIYCFENWSKTVVTQTIVYGVWPKQILLEKSMWQVRN